jgi:hypothetical protein
MPVRQTEAAPGRTDGHAEPAYQIVLTDVSRLRLLPCSPDPKGFAPAIAGRRRPVAPEPLDRGHQILDSRHCCHMAWQRFALPWIEARLRPPAARCLVSPCDRASIRQSFGSAPAERRSVPAPNRPVHRLNPSPAAQHCGRSADPCRGIAYFDLLCMHLNGDAIANVLCSACLETRRRHPGAAPR